MNDRALLIEVGGSWYKILSEDYTQYSRNTDSLKGQDIGAKATFLMNLTVWGWNH